MSASPFLRLRSPAQDDMLADAAICVVMDKGLLGLSVRAVADWVGVSSSAISQRVNRPLLMLITVRCFVDRWIEWVTWREHAEGVLALLPSDEEEVRGVRVWLALIELGRTSPELAVELTRIDDFERWFVRRRCQPTGADPDLVAAVVAGLRLRTTDPVRPLALAEARAQLERLVAGGGAAGGDGG